MVSRSPAVQRRPTPANFTHGWEAETPRKAPPLRPPYAVLPPYLNPPAAASMDTKIDAAPGWHPPMADPGAKAKPKAASPFAAAAKAASDKEDGKEAGKGKDGPAAIAPAVAPDEKKGEKAAGQDKGGGGHPEEKRSKAAERGHSPRSGTKNQRSRLSLTVGSASLNRPGLTLRAAAAAFTAPRTLGPEPKAVQGSTAAKDATANGAHIASARSAYAGAADEAYALYRRLNEAAERVVADARRQSEALAGKHRNNLATGLSDLASGTVAARTRLGSACERAVDRVRLRSRILKDLVSGASDLTLQRLAALCGSYQAALAGPRKQKDASIDKLSSNIGAITTVAAGASGKLQGFAKDPGASLKADGAIGEAVKEMQIAFLPPHIARAEEGLAKQLEAIQKYLGPVKDCLPCKFDSAFQGVEAQIRSLSTSGPEAVVAARDGALENILATEAQLETSIRDNCRRLDDQLLEQHERTRESLIAQARANGESERIEIEQSAARHSETLTTVAGAQPMALAKAHGEFEKSANLSPADFAQSVKSQSRQLRTNLSGLGARHPSSTFRAAASALAPREARLATFSRGRQQTVERLLDGFEALIAANLRQLGASAEEGLDRLAGLPGQVRDSGDSIINSAASGLKDSVSNLEKQSAAAAKSVDDAIAGGGGGGGGDKKGDGGDKAGADTGAAKEGGKPAGAQPASCGACKQEGEKKPGETGKGDTGNADGPKGQGTGGEKADGGSPGAENPLSSTAFGNKCNGISTDPTTAEPIPGFLKQAHSKVVAGLIDRAGRVRKATDTVGGPETDQLMGALRGMTPAQGAGLKETYRTEIKRDIEADIKAAYKRAVFSAESTDKANSSAAINMLNGQAVEGAMDELKAAFNYSNENDRIREVLENLTPAQMAEMNTKHKGALDELQKQLDGKDLAIFQALRAGKPEEARSIQLREKLDAAAYKHGEARGDETAKILKEASGDFSKPIWGDKKEGAVADIYGLEDGGIRKARQDQHWKDVQTAFAGQEGVAKTAGTAPGASASDVLIAYATRDTTYWTEDYDSPGYGAHEGGGHAMKQATDVMGGAHKNWVRQIVECGPDSKQAKAAELLVERKRTGKKPEIKTLDSVLHAGAGDAVEGGAFRHGSAEEEKAEQDEILVLSEEMRRTVDNDPTHGPIDPAAVKKALHEEVAAKFKDDPEALELVQKTIDKPGGDARAAMDYAIAKENPEMALRYLKRMDSEQVKALVAEWNEKNPGGPTLEQKLGLFEHHWSFWSNWSGSTFSGDEANELEIAFMGVPQNDKQRAEVALRVMDQTIDQSTWLGSALAGEEMDNLKANRARLAETVGVTKGGINDRGQIETHDQFGQKLRLNFDEDGNFTPPEGGDATGLEQAIALASITSQNYKEATDRIANYLTTALMVAAAIITTVATGGAAASIWIPVLVTAGAGLVGIGISAGIKGGRYSRDDFKRDLANTVIQAATAGIGAAAGAAMRGGAPALKAVAGKMRVPEAVLMKMAGTGGFKALSFGQNVAMGAGTGALGGAATAAFDPAAQRSETYGKQILAGFFRGALSGGISAGVAHKMAPALMGKLQNEASKRAFNLAIARGASPEAAMRFASLKAQALATSALTDIATRALVSGASGSLARGSELGFNSLILGQHMSAREMLGEMGSAFLQNAVQAAGEAGGDRRMRGLSSRRMREHVAVQKVEASRQRQEASKKAAAALEAEQTQTTAPKVTGDSADEQMLALPPAKPQLLLDPGTDTDLPIIARTADSDAEDGAGAKPVTLASANDNPAGPTHAKVALSGSEMVTSGSVVEGSIFVHPDSKSLKAANDNFATLLNADPSREAAVYHNPVTGEYVVIQGDKGSVASIRPGGELEGPGASGRLVSKNGIPEPGGHWVLRHHFHPNRKGEKATRMLRRIPSGADGDFAVIVREANAYGYDQHSSRIYFVDNGKLSFTDFGFDTKSAKGRYWIDFPEPGTGVRTRREFANIGEYHQFIRSIAGADVGPVSGGKGGAKTADADHGGLDPRRRAGGAEAALEDRMTAQNLNDADYVAGRVGSALALDPQIRAGARDPEAEYHALMRIRTPADAQALVSEMGLVDRPDSMIRLAALISDPALQNPAGREKAARVAKAVLDATREAMIRDGRLAEGDDLIMFFHGAPPEQIAKYREQGIDMRLASPKGEQEDLHSGSYMSRDLQSADIYGQPLPWIVKKSDLGNVLDISPGSPLRKKWEAYALRNAGRGGAQMVMDLETYLKRTFKDLVVNDGRGELFEGFRQSLLNDPDPAIRKAAADLDIALNDLGGQMTSGKNREFPTDQAAVKSQRLADMMNEQLGFPFPVTEADMLESHGPARTADVDPLDDASAAATTAKADQQSKSQKDLDRAETAFMAVMSRHSEEFFEFFTVLSSVDQVENQHIAQLLLASDTDARIEALRTMAGDLKAKGVSAEDVTETLKHISAIEGRVRDRFQLTLRHLELLADPSTQAAVATLSPRMKTIVEESPLALHLMLSSATTAGGKTAFAHYSERTGRKKPPVETGADFEAFVKHSLSKSKDPNLVALNTTLAPFFAKLGDYNAGLEAALPATRAATGERLDLSRPPLVNAPNHNLDGLIPFHPSDTLEPGTRVDHPDFGRGTVVEVENGVAKLSFDQGSNHPNDFVAIPLAELSLFPALNGITDQPVKTVPIRKKTEQKAYQDKIDAFRSEKEIMPFHAKDESGTVAIAKVGDAEFFGTNSTMSAGLATLTLSERNEFLHVLKLMGIKPDKNRAQFMDHAEAAALFAARQRLGSGGMPEVVELFVDRSTCGDCRANLHKLAEYLGVAEIRVYYRNQETPPPPLIIKARP